MKRARPVRRFGCLLPASRSEFAPLPPRSFTAPCHRVAGSATRRRFELAVVPGGLCWRPLFQSAATASAAGLKRRCRLQLPNPSLFDETRNVFRLRPKIHRERILGLIQRLHVRGITLCPTYRSHRLFPAFPNCKLVSFFRTQIRISLDQRVNSFFKKFNQLILIHLVAV